MEAERMKSVIYYYSLEGNTQSIAKRIAEGTKRDICRLVSKKSYPKNGLKYFFGGMDVTLKRCPKIEPLTKNPESYDLIVLATPVWASSFTPAIRSFLKDHNLSGKKIILVATTSGGDAGKCFTAMRAALGESEIVGEYTVKSPVADHEQAASAVVEKIRKQLNA
jgi:flavodoxin